MRATQPDPKQQRAWPAERERKQRSEKEKRRAVHLDGEIKVGVEAAPAYRGHNRLHKGSVGRAERRGGRGQELELVLEHLQSKAEGSCVSG